MLKYLRKQAGTLIDRIFQRGLERQLTELKRLQQETIHRSNLESLLTANRIPYTVQISLGGASANASLLWLITRFHLEFDAARYCELGAGSTTKIMSALTSARKADIVSLESDEWWWKAHQSLPGVRCLKTSLIQTTQLGHNTAAYDASVLPADWMPQLLIVDAPIGTPQHSRIGSWILIERMIASNDFFIIFDDYDRPGERQTVKAVLQAFQEKGVQHSVKSWSGIKSQCAVFSSQYKGALYW